MAAVARLRGGRVIPHTCTDPSTAECPELDDDVMTDAIDRVLRERIDGDRLFHLLPRYLQASIETDAIALVLREAKQRDDDYADFEARR